MTDNKIVYAEDLPYWKTSQSAPDKWLERIAAMIRKDGGEVLQQGYLQASGQAAYMLLFVLGENRYKITWPVMQSKTKSEYAAKVQAVTMMYHDVKNRLVTAIVPHDVLSALRTTEYYCPFVQKPFDLWSLKGRKITKELP